jgi:hypothetical protein
MSRLRHHRVDAASSDAEAPEDFVMFFLGPDGEFLEHEAAAAPHRTVAEIGRAWRALLESDPRAHAHSRRLDPRLVQGTGRPTRGGYRDEIVVTACASPESAVAVAVGSTLFSPPIRRLAVDESSLTSRRYELGWDALVTLRPWHRRRVRVRLYASPSLNVTVLAMSPVTSRPSATRRFLAVGNQTMNDLRDRLDEIVARHASTTSTQSSRAVTT